MKKSLLLLTLLALLTATILAFNKSNTTQEHRQTKTGLKKVIRCGPDWEQLESYFQEVEIPPIAGAGNYKWKISTTSDSAQFYFNQGINMYYSFHIIEGMASFKKAARFDPNSAMLYWAQALAYGPNINDVGYAASPEALAATDKAIRLAANSKNVKEKMLVAAMAVRYSADSTQTREYLNQRYVDKMKEMYSRYPDDADVAALYADAMMLQHPWDLWKTDGTPKPWTPLIRQVLEKLLAKTPNHPGANHYYIHVMEPSPYFAKALPSADRLGKLTPGLSHTVHMPSHIYLRSGNYDQGIKVNEKAVASYREIVPVYGAVTGNDFLYVIHNLHMQTNHAMMTGNATYSVKSATETMNSIPKDYLSLPGGLGNYIQYIYMTPTLVDIRFARWEELLARTQPDKSLVYANVLYHFGRGMAFTNTSKEEDAKRELEEINMLIKDSALYAPFPPFSPAIDAAKIAKLQLTGMIGLQKNNYEAAMAAFETALTIENNLVYNEPRDWILNTSHWLGKAYLDAAKYSKAEAVYLKDLQVNNENPWALQGLYHAKMKLKKKDAGMIQQRYRKASAKADVKINTSIL